MVDFDVCVLKGAYATEACVCTNTFNIKLRILCLFHFAIATYASSVIPWTYHALAQQTHLSKRTKARSLKYMVQFQV